MARRPPRQARDGDGRTEPSPAPPFTNSDGSRRCRAVSGKRCGPALRASVSGGVGRRRVGGPRCRRREAESAASVRKCGMGSRARVFREAERIVCTALPGAGRRSGRCPETVRPNPRAVSGELLGSRGQLGPGRVCWACVSSIWPRRLPDRLRRMLPHRLRRMLPQVLSVFYLLVVLVLQWKSRYRCVYPLTDRQEAGDGERLPCPGAAGRPVAVSGGHLFLRALWQLGEGDRQRDT